MAIDVKYGRVTMERGTVGEDEIVVVFRARDWALPKLLRDYRFLCEELGSPQKHLDTVKKAMEAVTRWQDQNGSQVPRSDSYQPPAYAESRED
jgi:predicted RND superfamily exporter protein